MFDVEFMIAIPIRKARGYDTRVLTRMEQLPFFPREGQKIELGDYLFVVTAAWFSTRTGLVYAVVPDIIVSTQADQEQAIHRYEADGWTLMERK